MISCIVSFARLCESADSGAVALATVEPHDDEDRFSSLCVCCVCVCVCVCDWTVQSENGKQAREPVGTIEGTNTRRSPLKVAQDIPLLVHQFLFLRTQILFVQSNNVDSYFASDQQIQIYVYFLLYQW